MAPWDPETLASNAGPLTVDMVVFFNTNTLRGIFEKPCYHTHFSGVVFLIGAWGLCAFMEKEKAGQGGSACLKSTNVIYLACVVCCYTRGPQWDKSAALQSGTGYVYVSDVRPYLGLCCMKHVFFPPKLGDWNAGTRLPHYLTRIYFLREISWRDKSRQDIGDWSILRRKDWPLI